MFYFWSLEDLGGKFSKVIAGIYGTSLAHMGHGFWRSRWYFWIGFLKWLPFDENDRICLCYHWNSKILKIHCLTLISFHLVFMQQLMYVFTKLLIPVPYRLRSLGHVLVSYLDDFLWIGISYVTCFNNVNVAKNLLIKLGFLTNEEKSQVNLKTKRKFLGFNFDSFCMTLIT